MYIKYRNDFIAVYDIITIFKEGLHGSLVTQRLTVK